MKRKIFNRDKKTPRINAYHYANDFEKLSLEIVKIICETTDTEDNISYRKIADEGFTKKTRDKGVDSYIILSVNNGFSTYTVESKLRTASVLSLKDFATSILYYLINTSAKHFVVSNVIFSKDATDYINRLNSDSDKPVELVDGKQLQNLLNKYISRFYGFPDKLIHYILNASFQERNISQDFIPAKTVSDNIISYTGFEEKFENFEYSKKIGKHQYMLIGKQGTGKHTWLKECINRYFNHHIVYLLDLSELLTPKILVYEILRILLKIDISKIFSFLFSNEDEIDEYFEEFQKFPGMEKKMIKPLKDLLSQNLSPAEYIYSMKLLMEYLSINKLIKRNGVIVIHNLHSANCDMILFTTEIIKYFYHKNYYIFWELLIPVNSSQLVSVTLQQWYSYIQAIKSFNSDNTYQAKEIYFEDLSYTDLKEVIERFLNMESLSEEYYQVFFQYFGNNQGEIFEVLRYIKNQNAYSAVLLKKLKNTHISIIGNHIFELVSDTNTYCSFYNKAFTYTYLLDYKLYPEVLAWLNKDNISNPAELLTETGFFFCAGNGKIIFKSEYKELIKKILKPSVVKECAMQLLGRLQELSLDSVSAIYYDAHLTSIAIPQQSLNKIDTAIHKLSKQHAYPYAMNLAKVRYLYYISVDDLLYFKFFVEYILCAEKINISTTEFISAIKEAEKLRSKMTIQYFDNDVFQITSVKLALIQYRMHKSSYEYEECEKYIRFILDNDKISPASSFYITAKIYYALIQKEKGDRKGFIKELVDNLKKYPSNNDVKITYYVNMAAMYKFKNKSIAIQLLKQACANTYKEQNGCGDLETEMNILNIFATDGVFNRGKLYVIREVADKNNSTDILAKTFNLEAYYDYYSYTPELYKKIMINQKTSIQHSILCGYGKPYFLYSLNYIQLKLAVDGHKANIMEDFEYIFQWFKRNQTMILKRLQNNPYMKNDHMYAALISMLYIIKKIGRSTILDITEIKHFFPNLLELGCSQLLACIPTYYKLKTIIFILF